MLHYIEGGSSVSEAMSQQGQSFDRTEVGLVQLGEKSGRLHHVLERICQNLEEQSLNRQRIVQASLYPAMAFIFALGLVGMMTFGLLPKLLPIFESFQVELPWPTRLVLHFSQLWSWGIPVGAALGLGAMLYWRDKPAPKHLLYSLPLFGSALRTRALGEMAASLATLLASGATLDSSLTLLASQTEDPLLGHCLHGLKSQLRAGVPLPEALQEESRLPILFRQLLSTGAETGRIDFFAERVAEICLDDFSWQLDRAVQLLEPMLLLFLGGVVGLMILACFLPFYHLLSVSL
jgi:type II secretory pathway component PulF